MLATAVVFPTPEPAGDDDLDRQRRPAVERCRVDGSLRWHGDHGSPFEGIDVYCGVEVGR